MNENNFQTEWCLLQNQFDSYEKHSLYIKLIAVIVLVSVEITGVINLYLLIILAVLWLQDAIWKTFQSRIERRLRQVEKSMIKNDSSSEFQFNSEFYKNRLSGLSLIVEYLCHAIRPTVAFPHCILILILLIQCIL